MSTKIQINSLEALERLIGGDSEFEMEIRQSVAADFAKKYLKGTINTNIEQSVKEYNNNLLAEVRKVFQEATNIKRDLWGNIQLPSEVKTTIRETVVKTISETIKEETSKMLGEQYPKLQKLLEEHVAQFIDYRMKLFTRKVVEEEIKKKLKDAGIDV